MVVPKYKTDIKLVPIFIIFGLLLQIININYYNFQITMVPISYNLKPISLRTLSLITLKLLVQIWILIRQTFKKNDPWYNL